MIKIGICDDVLCFVNQLSIIVKDWAHKRGMRLDIRCFQSGEDLLADAELSGEFHAVFLDVELEGISGVETAVELRKQDPFVSIVFMTQYDNYFRQMLESSPCYYVEKPFLKEKVFMIMDNVVGAHKYQYTIYSFRYARKTYKIMLRKVLYFVSEKRKIKVLMEDGKEYSFYKKLDKLEEELKEFEVEFLRIHKSFLINERQIEMLHPGYVKMRNGENLSISRERREKVLKHHMCMLEYK